MKITKEQRLRAASYPKSVRWSEEDACFIGRIEGLAGDCHHGDDPVEVFRVINRLAEETVAEWETANLELPKAPKKKTGVQTIIDAAKIRRSLHMSQTEFANLIHVSVKTLHKWEHKTAKPNEAARSLLRIAAVRPDVLIETLG